MPAIWPVGDSLTHGSSWSGETPGGWRGTLADALAADGQDSTWLGSTGANPPPGRPRDRHDGHPGWRADELATELPGWRAGLPTAPDLIVLQAGSNDLIQRHDPGRSDDGAYDEFSAGQRAEFAADLAERLDGLARLALKLCPDARLVLWTVPPMGLGGPRYGSPTLPAVNRLLAGQVVPGLLADGLPVTLADIHLLLAPDTEVTAGVLGTDGVHPTPTGYVAIAGTLAAVLRPLLA